MVNFNLTAELHIVCALIFFFNRMYLFQLILSITRIWLFSSIVSKKKEIKDRFRYVSRDLLELGLLNFTDMSHESPTFGVERLFKQLSVPTSIC